MNSKLICGFQIKNFVAFRFRSQPDVFNRVSFGLKDSMQGFIAALRTVIYDLEHDVAIYVDNLLVFSTDIGTHVNHLNRVIKRTQDAGMTLRLDKCQFFQSQVKFLGFIIDSAGVLPDPKKAEAIYAYKEPTTKKEVKVRRLYHSLNILPSYVSHVTVFNFSSTQKCILSVHHCSSSQRFRHRGSHFFMNKCRSPLLQT